MSNIVYEWYEDKKNVNEITDFKELTCLSISVQI